MFCLRCLIALSLFLNKFITTPCLHLFGAYSFFYFQLYNITIIVSIRSCPYFINLFTSAPCCFSIIKCSYTLLTSYLVNSLCNPYEPRSCLSDALTFASAHALISFSLLRRTLRCLWAFLACGNVLQVLASSPSSYEPLPFCAIKVAIPVSASPAC